MFWIHRETLGLLRAWCLRTSLVLDRDLVRFERHVEDVDPALSASVTLDGTGFWLGLQVGRRMVYFALWADGR